MINKIKNKLIFTNTFVLLVILILMTSFIYLFASYSFYSRSEDTMINMLYQAKRYSQNNFQTKKNDYSYNQELIYFKDRIKEEKSKIMYLDKDYNILYKNGDLKVKDSVLKKLAKAYFSDETKNSELNVVKEDGRYVITEYNSNNINFNICETVVSDDNGEIRILLIAKNNIDTNKTMSTLFYVLLFTIIIGVLASLIGGYFTADKALVPIKNNMESQKQFIADISHELRTPIAVIKTNLELIETNKEETIKSQEVWINYAKNEAARMDKIVGDLLILSKAELGQIPFNVQETEITFLIKKVIEQIESIAIKKEIRIFMTCKYSKVNLNIDPDKFEQLLVILLDNAIKYSEKKTQIVVSVNIDEAKNNAIISVKDQGIGIAKDEIDKIFSRFYRVDKARSRKEKGTGLGLSIAEWIVENLNGKIKVESELGKGTDFIIKLPLVGYEENK